MFWRQNTRTISHIRYKSLGNLKPSSSRNYWTAHVDNLSPPQCFIVSLRALQVAGKGQPGDTPETIRKLVQSYIQSDLTIILTVVAANADMMTHKCLGIATEADPSGKRTLMVMTKLDLKDRGKVK